LGPENRTQWVARHLHCMADQGVHLPDDSLAITEACDMDFPENYGFDERALVKGWKVEMSWQAFKKQGEISSDYLCVETSNLDEGTASEAFDFGLIQEAKLAPLRGSVLTDKALEIREVATRITQNLRDLLDDMHAKKTRDGFRPIAWHNVWWYLTDHWDALPLKLDLKDPCCETDDRLAAHIGEHYSDVQKVNRLNMQRRRTRLEAACSESIFDELKGWSNGGGTTKYGS
jgi:hypothetical protein